MIHKELDVFYLHIRKKEKKVVRACLCISHLKKAQTYNIYMNNLAIKL
jgi:hypothetical protein